MSANFSYSRFPHDFIRKGYSAKAGPYGTTILACLCFHMNNTTGECFPSEETIAKEMGISRNSVRKYVKQLEELKIIKRRKKESIHGREVFHYIINPPDKWVKKGNDICAPHCQAPEFRSTLRVRI